MNALAARLGLEAASLGGHALRSGFLTSAVARGFQAGRSVMDTLRGYVRDAEIFKRHAGEAYCKKPVSSLTSGATRSVYVAQLPRPRDFTPTVIPAVRPLLDCRPVNHRRGDISSDPTEGQEVGAIHSDLAKRGRQVVLRRLSAVAPVLMCGKSSTLAPFHFRNLSGGLSRRTASALHGPWPRPLQRRGARSVELRERRE